MHAAGKGASLSSGRQECVHRWASWNWYSFVRMDWDAFLFIASFSVRGFIAAQGPARSNLPSASPLFGSCCWSVAFNQLFGNKSIVEVR